MSDPKELMNVMPSRGGKVHKVIRLDKYTGQPIPDEILAKHPKAGIIGRVCDPMHDPNKPDPSTWFGWFIHVDGPVTCGNCLRNYWPDGRRRG